MTSMDSPSDQVPVSVTRRVITTAGGPLGVARIDAQHDPDRVFYVAMGYAACIDPFELQRFTLLARRLEARLIVVETPGYSHARTRLTMNERLGLLLKSDFVPVAARMLRAAQAVDTTARTERRIGVLGYSLGASMAAAMAGMLSTDRRGLNAIVLVEPVGHQSWTIRDLLTATRHEDTLIDHYLAENTRYPGVKAPNDRTPRAATAKAYGPDLWLLANAMRSGRLGEDVLAAATGTATHLIVVHGISSLVSTRAASQQLVSAARARGITVTDLPVAGSHGLWQSLTQVDRLARQLATALGGNG